MINPHAFLYLLTLYYAVLEDFNEEGKGLLLSFFNKYYYDKKLVITYENSLTEIYERAVITNNSPGDYIMGAIHSHIYKMQNINSLDY